MILKPTPMTQDDLIIVIEDILERVKLGDSFEGFLNYLMPFPPAGDPECDFMVEARYRVGNTMGQGGMKIIGKWADE